jgi:3-hydroxy-9,10-secoandrosta-1,3,5(10)-triene-9,17-dione monooxygenase
LADPSRQSMLEAAYQLGRRARELEPETTFARRIPEELIDAFHQSGLLRVLQPARFGGMEADLVDMIDIADIIGRGSGSAAWVYAVFASHVLTLACYPEETQREIWDGHPTHVASSAYNSNRMVHVPGGYRMSGKWSFMSGIDFAQWCILLGEVEEEVGQPPTAYTCLVPRADVEIIDDWFALGMAGTGSKSVIGKDLFVPERRVIPFLDAVRGETPGTKVNPGPLYRCPRFSCTGYVLAAVVLGIATGFLDRFVDYAHTRRRRPVNTGSMADLSSMQLRLAESACEVDAARLMLRRNCIETGEALKQSGPLPEELRARNRRDNAFVTTLCTRAVDRLFAAAGAHAILETCPLLLSYRDIHTGAAQIVLNFESAAMSYGRIRMGLAPDDPLL